MSSQRDPYKELISAYIHRDIKKAFREAAVDLDVTMSDLLVAMVSEFCKQPENEQRKLLSKIR
jgi:hypothetical protein